MPGMLEGIRVVEMGHVVAIPSCGALLADWGADVVKLEPPTGDLTRSLRRTLGVEATVQYEGGTMHWMFEQLNRGKRGIVLDLRRPGGREVAYRMVASADAFISNYEVGALAKLAMDYQSLRQVNPRLVHAVLTGYGTVGPDKDERGFDYSAAWARSGLQYLIGEPGTPPPPQRPGFMDNVTAAHAAAGVLGALLHRERTGEGQNLEFSLYQSAVWSNNMDTEAALLGRPLPKDDRTRSHNPLWNTYQTKDGRWLRLAMLQPDPYWPPFCQAIGRPELENDPRFHDMDARRDNNEELIRIVDAIFATRTSAEWERILREHQCIYGRVQSVSEVVVDPQALANGFFAPIDHPVAGQISVVASPAKLGRTPARVSGPAPMLGQHTEAVLLDLGYSWDEIAELQAAGVIP